MSHYSKQLVSKIALTICILLSINMANACKLKAIDGRWSGTIGDSVAGMFVCDFTLAKGGFSGSCYDHQQDYIWPVFGSYGVVGDCNYELSFNLGGNPILGAVALDRKKRLVINGMVVDQVTGWPGQLTLVRKQ